MCAKRRPQQEELYTTAMPAYENEVQTPRTSRERFPCRYCRRETEDGLEQMSSRRFEMRSFPPARQRRSLEGVGSELLSRLLVISSDSPQLHTDA